MLPLTPERYTPRPTPLTRALHLWPAEDLRDVFKFPKAKMMLTLLLHTFKLAVHFLYHCTTLIQPSVPNQVRKRDISIPLCITPMHMRNLELEKLLTLAHSSEQPSIWVDIKLLCS